MSFPSVAEQSSRCPAGMVEIDSRNAIPLGMGQLAGTGVGYSCVPGTDQMPLEASTDPDANLHPNLAQALATPHTTKYYNMDIPQQPEPPTIRREFYELPSRSFPGERRYGLNMNVDHQPVFLADAHLLVPNRLKRWDAFMRPEPFAPQDNRGYYEEPLIAAHLPAERSYLQGC